MPDPDDLTEPARRGRRLGVWRLRRLPRAGVAGQVARFSVVGAVSTVLTLAVFAMLAVSGAPHQVANLAGLAAGTVLNTTANRFWTFGVRGPDGALRHQLQGLVMFGMTWVLTAGSLGVLEILAPEAGTLAATTTVAVGTVIATVLKFLAFRAWMRPG